MGLAASRNAEPLRTGDSSFGREETISQEQGTKVRPTSGGDHVLLALEKALAAALACKSAESCKPIIKENPAHEQRQERPDRQW